MSGSNSSPASAPAQPPQDDEPLAMTVHALPSPGAAQGAGNRVGGRAKMLLVLLVCLAPVLASYFTYYVIRPEGRRSFGELIEPQRDVPDAQAKELDGTATPLSALKGQWLLVSVAGGQCDAQCEKHLYLQRQLLTSLGKDRDRFDWVWLVSDEQPVRAALRPALQPARVLRVAPAVLQEWLRAEPGHQLADHLYVVDPMGRWMMRFPVKLDNTGAMRAKRDLERLLRASSSWDNPGREGAGS